MSDREIDIVHFTPGRIRLRVPRLKRERPFGGRLQQRLLQVQGIQQVEISDLTGSVLVLYDPDTLSAPGGGSALAAALHDLFPNVDFQSYVNRLELHPF